MKGYQEESPMRPCNERHTINKADYFDSQRFSDKAFEFLGCQLIEDSAHHITHACAGQ